MMKFLQRDKKVHSSSQQRKSRMTLSSWRKIGSFLFMPQFSKMLAPFSVIGTSIARTVGLTFSGSRLLSKETVKKVHSGASLSLMSVLSEARSNLTWSKKSIPEIGLYASVVGVLAFTVLTLTTVALNMFVGSAFAAEYFSTENETTDIGLSLLYMLFGIGGNGVGDGDLQGSIAAVQTGLRAMLEFYSLAMLVFGCLIITYNLVAIVMESAHHGQPFGKRHSAIYTPIRTVFAIAMLLPIVSFGGLNLGQVSVLKVAELGSNLASNTWAKFVTSIGADIAKSSQPPTPLISSIVENQFLMAVCTHSYNVLAADLVKDSDEDAYAEANSAQIPLLASEKNAIDKLTSTFSGYDTLIRPYMRGIYVFRDDASDWSFDGIINNIQSLFGYPLNTTISGINQMETPVCGSIKLIYPEGVDDTVRARIYSAHIKAISEIFVQMSQDPNIVGTSSGGVYTGGLVRNLVTPGQDPFEGIDGQTFLKYARDYQAALIEASNEAKLDADEQLAEYMTTISAQDGWVGAPKFYNHIARVNGQLQEYARQLPIIEAPDTDQMRKRIRHRGGNQAWVRNRMTINQKVAHAVDNARRYYEEEYAKALKELSSTATSGDDADSQAAAMLGTGDEDNSPKIGETEVESGDNASGYLTKIAALVIGSDSEKIRKGNYFEFDANAPLASISSFGHAQINRALTFLTMSAIISITLTGGGSPLDMVLSLLATIGLSAGVILAYMVPLLPFIRFMTGVLAWLMGIMEAVVAVPIMALGHLNTEGEGLPGPMARQGYMLLLQLFLRPVMMIFGLVLSISLFMIAIFALNQLWQVVALDAYGESSMNVFASFIYSVIYAVIAYSMANMCFKLIDLLPNESLRWIGSGGLTGPQDEGGDVRNALIATAAVSSQVADIADKLGGGKTGLAGYLNRKKEAKAKQAREDEFDEMLRKRGILPGGGSGGDGSGSGGSITQA